MTMEEILLSAPAILAELTEELVRRADEEFRKNSTSQSTACFFLAIRSTSLLLGMSKLLLPETRDSSEVLVRGFLEARDLLMTFRFDEKGTRNKITFWFDGKLGTSWKPDHKKCEQFMERLGHGGSRLATKWSQMTTLAHPTRFAAQNSVYAAALWAANPPRIEDYISMMEPKIADYLTSIATIIVIATIDMPGLISLGCDLDRMPNIDKFREDVCRVVLPILNKRDSDLPSSSYRSS
ncbi:MAG: hypothetical protein H0X25_18400 [Acidobacteriales bacterium]|nr:hypothetical protein [Terriglobales bacterium]